MSGISVFLADKGIYFLTAFLLVLGIYGMITCKNYMKKLICMNIMQVAVIFFFLCFGQKNGGTIPVQVTGLMGARHYINPLPHGLMLTAIVVSLGTTGVGLALLTRIKEKYGSIEEDDIIKGENKF
ncbi:MAG: cation:proton antiporter subunit C [Mobilibacterium timonense]|nr:cation:proton antiporter subunit C [Mobilibacterium timonense]